MAEGPARKPTSFDVARLAGVSRSAVSRAYTPGAHIAEDTQKKVFAAAEELGYRVNSLARALHAPHSGIVGLIASRLDTPLRSRQVRLLGQALIRKGFRPMLITAEQPDEVGGLIDSLLSYNVAGMIVTSDTPPRAMIEDCGRLRMPVVLVNRAGVTSWGDRIVADSETAGHMAFGLLTGAGATNLACLAPRIETFTVTGRANAFIASAENSDTPVQQFFSEDQSYEASRAAIAALPQGTFDNIDGLFCATDLMALGSLDGLRLDHGLSVPDDIQVVGFDDIEQAGWGAYNLTTIQQDLDDQVDQVMHLLQERMANPELPRRTVTQTLSPVIRGTTKHDH